MTEGVWSKQNWKGALYFSERLNIVTNWDSFPGANSHLLERWRGLKAFNSPSVFEARIAEYSVTPEQFEAIVLDKVQLDLDKGEFSWLDELKDSFENYFNASSDFVNDEQLVLIKVCKPVIFRKLVELLSIERGNSKSFESTLTIFLPMLYSRLYRVVYSAVIMELHVEKELGTLVGESSEERFNSYIVMFENKDFCLSFFQEYSVLARCVIETTNQWGDFLEDFFEHLHADLADMEKCFCPNRELGILQAISSEAGDSHNFGRTVLIATFTSGLKLVYKPRSLELDIQYNNLLDWMNERTDFNFRTIRNVDKSDHGWVEFVSFSSASKECSVNEYFRRLGGLMGLLYILQSTDFHFENLIASGSQPVFIDLECLFHPVAPQNYEVVKEYRDGYTINMLGMLPQSYKKTEVGTGLDISGIAGIGGQRVSDDSIFVDGEYTDEMRTVNKEWTLEAENNLAKLDGAIINPLCKKQHIVDGFVLAYKTIREGQSALLKNDGVINKFMTSTTRNVFRGTGVYLKLLSNSYHPNNLRNALERDCWFDNLWLEKDFPGKSQLVTAEIFSLRSGNIPHFTSRPKDNAFKANDTNLEGVYLTVTTYESVKKRILSMDDNGLDSIVSAINASFDVFAENLELMSLYENDGGQAGRQLV